MISFRFRFTTRAPHGSASYVRRTKRSQLDHCLHVTERLLGVNLALKVCDVALGADGAPAVDLHAEPVDRPGRVPSRMGESPPVPLLLLLSSCYCRCRCYCPHRCRCRCRCRCRSSSVGRSVSVPAPQRTPSRTKPCRDGTAVCEQSGLVVRGVVVACALAPRRQKRPSRRAKQTRKRGVPLPCKLVTLWSLSPRPRRVCCS